MNNNMNNSNDRSDLLKEMAVIEYVVGNQSQLVRRNFEKKLEQDSDLREAVETERHFQADMRKAGELKAVSMSNFDVLLSTIEAQENKETQEDNVTSIAANRNNEVPLEQPPSSVHYMAVNHFAKAASVAMFAIVFAGFYVNYSAPKFETLSDVPASEEINLSELTQQARLAKMVFIDNLLEPQIDDILHSYNLSTFEAGAEQNQRYVISESAISERELRLWRDNVLVQQVELFTTTEER